MFEGKLFLFKCLSHFAICLLFHLCKVKCISKFSVILILPCLPSFPIFNEVRGRFEFDHTFTKIDIVRYF